MNNNTTTKPEVTPPTKPEIQPIRPLEPTSPINPQAREKEAVKEFVNEGNPSTSPPKTEHLSADKVLENLSNPKNKC